jgi:small redox-active disulfide protein 2
MNIEVLGTGCSTCQTLETRVQRVVDEADLDGTVEKVEDMQEIMKYGVMSTPALVVDGEVKSSGRAPSVQELKDLLVA